MSMKKAVMAVLIGAAVVAGGVFVNASAALALDNFGLPAQNGGVFNIASPLGDYGNECMDIRGASGAEHAVAQTYACSTGWNQQFYLLRSGTINSYPVWRIEARFTHDNTPVANWKCLTVASVGVGIENDTCSSTWAQLFVLQNTTGSDYFYEYMIRPVYDMDCLQLSGTADLAPLRQAGCLATDPHDVWMLAH